MDLFLSHPCWMFSTQLCEACLGSICVLFKHLLFLGPCRAKLEQASRLPATEKWLKPHLDTPEGTEEVSTLVSSHRVPYPMFALLRGRCWHLI